MRQLPYSIRVASCNLHCTDNRRLIKLLRYNQIFTSYASQLAQSDKHNQWHMHDNKISTLPYPEKKKILSIWCYHRVMMILNGDSFKWFICYQVWLDSPNTHKLTENVQVKDEIWWTRCSWGLRWLVYKVRGLGSTISIFHLSIFSYRKTRGKIEK